MKAYRVEFRDSDWCDFIHAANARQARLPFWQEWHNEGEFIDIRAYRIPTLDNLPLIGEYLVLSGEDISWRYSKTYICNCEVCGGGNG